MTPRTEILPGVFLRCIQSDKFKTGGYSINLVRPLCREEAALNALIPSVLLRGTVNNPDIRSISMKLDGLYGANIGSIIRKRGSLQTMGLCADYVEDKLVGEPLFEQTAAFMRELLFEPLTENNGFQAAAVAGEKQNLINAIRARINNKRVYATTQMLNIMFRGEAYGIPRIGDEEDLAALTPQSLYQHYQNLLKTSRIELFYLGSQTPGKAAAVFTDMLAGLPRGTVCPACNSICDGEITPKDVTKRMPVSQSQLCIGYRTGAIDTINAWAVYSVFNILFGSGTNCKLFVKVREEKSLCYSIGSAVEVNQNLLVVYAGIDADKKQAAMQEIAAQLSACANGDFTDEELQVAKDRLVSIQRSGMDDPGNLDDFYVGQAMVRREGTMEELMCAAQKVTGEQVMQAAASVRQDTVFFLEGDAT